MEGLGLCLGCMNPKGDEEVCGSCGWREGTPPESSHYLPPGTVIKERYLLGRVLGQGGFGITYLGWDKVLNTRVAVKEFMPPGIAVRTLGQATVTALKSGEMENLFAYGIERFLDEARTLARFEGHPGVVWVKDVFRDNGTAYMVMQYLEGMTLSEYRLLKGGTIPYPIARGIIMPVLDTLREVHRGGILHRDVSPDNIFITREGTVKLLDFGAARFAMGEKSVNYSVILKAGYAPEEQYRSRGRQGEYTDVYSVAATLYQLITGQLPLEALDRLAEDTLLPPSQVGAEIPPAAEAALLKALSVKAGDRYQSIAEFQEALLGNRETEEPAAGFGQVDIESDETVPADVPDDVIEGGSVEADASVEPTYVKSFRSGLDRSTLTKYVVAASVVLLLGLGAAVYSLAGLNNSKQAGQSTDVNNEMVTSTTGIKIASDGTTNAGKVNTEAADTETANNKNTNTEIADNMTANNETIYSGPTNTGTATLETANTGTATPETANTETANTPVTPAQAAPTQATETYGKLTIDYGAIYEGEIKDGQPNGQGTMNWTNGDKYVGEFKNGKRDGQGTMRWSDGGKYVGGWRYDQRYGQGTMSWSNGIKYVGEWRRDGMEGQGTITWPNGRRYEGGFSGGRLTRGMMIFPPGAGTSRFDDWSGMSIEDYGKWP